MKEQVRVLHILQRMEAGGTQALLMNIYRNIDREKVQFDFLVEYPNKHFYDDEIFSLGGKIYYTNVRKDLNIIKFTKHLKKIIKENDYKIVHVHTYSIGYFCLKAAKNCGVPIRIAHSHSNSMTKDKKQVLKIILKKLYPKYATDLFACSEEAGRFLYENREFQIVTNAIKTQKFSDNIKNRDKLLEAENFKDKFVVGHVGRFRPEKNHTFLVKIFAEIKKIIPNAYLLMVGDGELENNIKEQLKELRLEKDFSIINNKRDIENAYQLMDIFIFPSLYEGLGIVAIEAQASGVPVLCSTTLPIESKVSPLYKKVDLNKKAAFWAKEALELANHPLAHTDMQQNIIESGFDISTTALKIQNFYIEKSRESRSLRDEKY